MSNFSIMDLELLFRSCVHAEKDLQEAERHLQVAQERYSQALRKFLHTPSVSENMNRAILESKRLQRNESRSRRNSAQAHLGMLRMQTMTELCALSNEYSEDKLLKSLRNLALRWNRQLGLQIALSVLILASVGIVVSLLFNSLYLYSILCLVVIIALSFLSFRIGSRRRELSGIFHQHVSSYLSRETQHEPRAVKLNDVEVGVSPSNLLMTPEYQHFDKMFRSSLVEKDRGALTSALRLRQEATALVEHTPMLYSLGKHNEMIIEYNHIGWGLESRISALESIKHEAEFKSISLELFPMFQTNFLRESLEFLVCSATSYEEALQYSERLNTLDPNPTSQRRHKQIKEMQKKSSRWYSSQRAMLNSLYSRVSPEFDAGRYAAGLATIDVILANADKVGYKLDREEYADLLDDMCAIAIQLFMEKMTLRPNGRLPSDDASELGCIFKKPLMYLADFFPECSPRNRDTFYSHYQTFANIPWIDSMPEWNRVSELLK